MSLGPQDESALIERLNSYDDRELDSIISGLEAEREETAKSSLTEYVKQIDVPGAPIDDSEDFYSERLIPAAHHELLIEQLEIVERGGNRRLVVLMPPGSAKSTYGTVCFPTWYLGRKPRRAIMSLSYGADLAKGFGRKCRQIVRGREFQDIFECRITGDNAAADNWSLTNGSEYFAGGMLMGITGKRVDGAVIDDPIKGREDADSKTIRDKVWETYKSDVRTRLKPHGFIILILTRWHEDDPAGRILPGGYEGETGWITGRDGERWYVLSLQAESERPDDPLGRSPGEFLWPEWFDPEDLAQEKITQGPRNWNALFQQRPAPETGSYFEREWIRYYDERPKHLRMYGASDFAVTEDDGDFTVHGIGGLDPDGDLYIVDWWRGQTASDIWIDVMLDLASVWRPLGWGVEKGQIEKAVGPFLKRRMRERNTFFATKPYVSATDKPTRAQAIRGRVAQGKVYLPRHAPWTADLVHYMMMFPAGTVDDDIDVLSLFGRMLNEMATGQKPQDPEPKEDRWSIALRRAEEANWKTI